jgi:signal transduction histidine kinase
MKQVQIQTILQQVREQLVAKDHLYYYLQLEDAIINSDARYTKTSLRHAVKQTFNIAWFEPQLQALFTAKDPDTLILVEILLKTILSQLTEHIEPAVMQKLVNQKTNGTVLEGITITKGAITFPEQNIFADETPFESIISSFYDILHVVEAHAKESLGAVKTQGILHSAFGEVQQKYGTLPTFRAVVKSFPLGVFDRQRQRTIDEEQQQVQQELTVRKEGVPQRIVPHINIRSLIQENSRLPLEERDYFYVYLTSENALLASDVGYTTESLRAVVKDNFNILWFNPKLKALFEMKNAEHLIFSEIILESILRHLSEEVNTATLQKIINQKTQGTVLEGVTITKGTVDMGPVEQKLFANATQLENATLLIHELLRSLSDQDKAVLNAAFTEIREKYSALPVFLEVIRALPTGVLENERRAILAPQAAAAAAAAAAYAAKEALQGEDIVPFMGKIDDANRLPLEEQAAAFTEIYRSLESFVEKNKTQVTGEMLREEVQNHVKVTELPLSFQFLFLSNEEQLLTLTEAFSSDFVHRLQLDDKSDLAKTKEIIAGKMPLLAFTKEGSFARETILAHLPEQNMEKELSNALTAYINFFYQKGVQILSVEDVRQALKASYSTIQQQYGAVAAKIFPLLPTDVLSMEERDTIAAGCYKIMVEGILEQVTDDAIRTTLSKTLLKMQQQQQQQQPNMQRLQKQFAELFETAAEKLREKIGHDQTEKIFETAYNNVKEQYGAYPIFSELLKAVPRGILEIERFTILSKEELTKVSKALKKTELMTSQFTNIAAHELKTPLISILSYSQMIGDKRKKYPLKKMREWARIIHENAKREERLVNDLLSISKLEAGEMKFDMSNINMGMLIKEAVTSLSPLAKERNIILKASIPKNLVYVNGDAQRLTQVITNLINNAIKFTEKGSVKVEATMADSMVQVVVVDTGAGINKEDIPNLFQKFYQTQNVTTRKTKGTGLGLAICKEIVQAHHGKIRIESAGIGKGSRFTFTIPTSQ